MNELVKRLGVFVVGNLIIFGILTVADNLINGKDVLGRKKVRRNENTAVDWNGNIVLGTNDFQVE